MAGELVEIGQVARPHGVRGELSVIPFTREPETFCQFNRLLIPDGSHGLRLFDVKQARPHKTSILLQLEDIRDRNQAESLVGAIVSVKREWLPETDDDEYYWTDLIGLMVYQSDGTSIGEVVNMLRTSAHDILVVDCHGREVLIPFQDEFVGEVDFVEQRISVTLPEGLLDL